MASTRSWLKAHPCYQKRRKLSRDLVHHYSDVIMCAMAFQIISLTIVYSTVYSGADQRKHQSTVSLAFVWGIQHAENVFIWWRHHVCNIIFKGRVALKFGTKYGHEWKRYPTSYISLFACSRNVLCNRLWRHQWSANTASVLFIAFCGFTIK